MSVSFANFPVNFDELREQRFAKLSPEKRDWFAKAPGAGLREMGLDGLAALGKRLAGATPVIHEGITTTDVAVPGPHGPVPTRIYRPEGGESKPVHFHVHAGGYVMIAGLDMEGTRLSNLAHELDCVVVAPDFRLPPTHKFPVGIEDCWAVLKWAFGNVHKYGGDASRMGIGGGCTGGVFSAVLALMARDENFKLRYLHMWATVTDTREQYRSYYEFATGYTLTRDTASYVTTLYLRDDSDRFDWRASPILVPSVKGLPPTLVAEGEWDVLHDEAKAWADRLRDAGVDVTFREYKEEGHSFSPPTLAASQAEFQAFFKAHVG
jgi:acetyl esterase